MSRKIFISYRRDDAKADARDLQNRLSKTFGKSNIFMDVDNLLIGQRFDQELEKALQHCDVFLAVIGPRWTDLLSRRNESGERDYVREEIAASLNHGAIVIPVLVDDAVMPAPEVLPEDLRDLALYQAHTVAHRRFGRDVEELVEGIKASRKARQKHPSWTAIATVTALGLLLVAGGGYFVWLETERTLQTQAEANFKAEASAQKVREAKRNAEAASQNEREAKRNAEAAAQTEREANRKANEEALRKELEKANQRAEEAERKHLAMLKALEAKDKKVENKAKGKTEQGPGGAVLQDTFADWSVLATKGEKRICFAAAQPTNTIPAGVNRSPVFFYISAWPSDGVKQEISVRLGYPVKPSSTVNVKIGNKTFNLFVKGDKAFVADAFEELRLVEAMKAGSSMTVDAESARGTKTTDHYSLSGITAALTSLAAACP